MKKTVECQTRVERIFKEIEDYFNDRDHRATLVLQTLATRTWWQELKKREGIVNAKG